MAQFTVKEQQVVYKTWIWTIEADSIEEVQTMIENSELDVDDVKYSLNDNENAADNIWSINDEEFVPEF